MKESIRQRAVELGFDLCRFAPATPPGSAARLDAWLADGRHGEMAYLQRNAAKRGNPQLVLPGARTMICLAASYAADPPLHGHESSPSPSPAPAGPLSPPSIGHRLPSVGEGWGEGWRGGAPVSGVQSADSFSAGALQTPASPVPDARPRGFVARYARHADYHRVLAGPLRTLAAFVDDRGGPGTRSLWYTDTGPLLERDFAERSGIGFVGKHTNVISRQLGNWILLAEILTSLELEPDPAERNRCGSCIRCITACPTGAITAPFHLDARLCISYLTIELKGPIPESLRPAIGNRIFGCDDCLAVCPWNRFAQEGRLMFGHRRRNLDEPDLLDLLRLDEPAFRARFRDTPLLRTKRRGLLRNVCVALGNVGTPHALPALETAANDLEPLVAEHARWAIAAIRRRTG